MEKDIDEKSLSCYVPRLIMQPILENAVEHGVEKQKDAFLRLKIYSSGEKLLLEVENSGEMAPDDEAKIERLLSDTYDASREKSGNLGIRNVHQRLRILYGAENGLSIFHTEHGTTLAKIILQKHEKPEKQADEKAGE